MTLKLTIPAEKVKIATHKMIARCSICDQRIRPNDRYLDKDYFGSNIIVHAMCWLEWLP